MDLIRKRYRKPKGRPCKRRSAQSANALKRWNKSVDKIDDSAVVEAEIIKNKDFKKQVLDLSRDVVRGKYIDCDSSLENEEVIDVCVSYDGTWGKRGHTSLHGIGIVIDILTGLVIDFEVLSKYCHDCVNSEGMLCKNTPEFRIWHDSHKNDCQKNFNGSSNSMEMNAAAILWKRSVKEAKMRYMTLLSDGDGKIHQHLNEIQVYGKKCDHHERRVYKPCCKKSWYWFEKCCPRLEEKRCHSGG
ncbi:hypothetical protein AVEN_108111-1 [Araneus ventricosus]|uniref:Mutator-like transposase domain-containing protein n=1 Tax=Araneus ventricosus TaxID=182803 RepID=A0A4Y2H7N9_ARAVE|nr:hypothetical protein AVEN_108111-1 [Araneus ventricosus]